MESLHECEPIIESFIRNHPENNIHRPASFIEAATMYQQVVSEDYGTTTMDWVQHTYYENYLLDEAERLSTQESKFVWPYTVAPYFTREEVEILSGFYEQSKPNPSYVNKPHHKTVEQRIQTCKDAIAQTTDPEEIARLRQELTDLGFDNDEDIELYEHMVRRHDEPLSHRTLRQRIDEYKEQLANTEDPEEIRRIRQSLADLGFDDGDIELYESTSSEFDPIRWDKRINILEYQLRAAEDPEDISMIKEQILEMGWNPEVDYTAENKLKAKHRIESIYQERFYNPPMDIQWLVESFSDTEAIIETKSNPVKPIHIVLVRGDSGFSGAISAITGSEFSHSAICLDNDFDRLYSFNLDNHYNFTGGFSFESISSYPRENRLAIFSFFVTPDDWERINERVQLLVNNIKSTNYSVINILTMPFKHINLNMPQNMICSQFVDSILKMSKIDITGKNSSKVVPGDLYNSSKNNAKAYKIFNGVVKDFDAKKAQRYIISMSRKAKPFTESATYMESVISEYLYPVVCEARKLPFEITPEGDVLLTNPNVDFDSEYSASHKLLMQYHQTNNINAMKYELARLYYMNYVLEKRLHSARYSQDRSKNTKTRARVLNDFNKYIKIVLNAEPEFNFGEYYENSVFYPHTVEVKKSTLLKLKDIVGYIL